MPFGSLAPLYEEIPAPFSGSASRPSAIIGTFPPRVFSAWTRDLVRTVEPLDFLGYSTNVVSQLNHHVRDGLLFGLELELNPEANWSRHNLLCALRMIHNQAPFFIAKQDGSVSRGVEIVTLPMTYSEIQEFARVILPLPARADSSCGIHMHITKAALSRNQQWRMIQFINCAPAESQTHLFLDQVARRRQTTYCQRSYFPRCPTTTSHYTAMGFSNTNPTMELRIFASTNKPLYLLSYVQFTQALVDYCHDDNAANFDFETPYKFIHFVNRNREKYPQLAQRFRHANFRSILDAMQAATSTVLSDDLAVSPEGEGVTYGEVPVVRRRFHPVTRERERRADTEIPSTAQVRTWILNQFGSQVDPHDAAVRLRGRAINYRATQRSFVTWYADNCLDPATGERRYIRTQRGTEVRGLEAIRSHALYHLGII